MQRVFSALRFAFLSIAIAGAFAWPTAAWAAANGQQTPSVGVGSQYDTAHVYVAPKDLDRFVASFAATFGGTASPQAVMTVTPTPSQTAFRAVITPAGSISAFGFKTPIPYPFGAERTGYLVTDMDAAVRAARTNGAAIVVAPFKDPIGRDAIIEWPGGVYMQLYWHTSPPHAAALRTVPENRIYIPTEKANEFIHDFITFSGGAIVSDVARAPGVEIGRPSDTYRRVRIESVFGKMTVLVTDGHLPYPFGRETTGYEVENLAATLQQAKTSGVTVLVAPYAAQGRESAVVQFPGGYIAEIHASAGK